jgi:hypothetical protein
MEGVQMSDTPRTDAAELETNIGVMHFDHKDLSAAYHFARQLERELNAANDRIKRLEDCIETAWGIIANVSGGDWTRQKPHWQEAVVRWRDNDFHPIMKELSERKAKESKP